MNIPDKQTDDDELIDESWLRSIGFAQYHFLYDGDADLVMRLPENSSSPGYLEWLEGRLVFADWLAAYKYPKERYNLPARTRGEARLTFTVLGLETK